MNDEIPTEPGLRERKRAATQAAIERAAVLLAVEHGYENVTVDMICEASMVSQRTFFNYFGSKEGVIIGTAPPAPSREQIDSFIHTSGAGVLADFVTLLSGALSDQEPDIELLRARRRIIQHTPHLMNSELAKIGALEDGFAKIVLARFRAQGRDGSDRELEDEARMVVSLSSGVMRYLMRAWTTAGTDKSPRELLQDAIDVLTRLADSDLRQNER